jgi:hypothetical protein
MMATWNDRGITHTVDELDRELQNRKASHLPEICLETQRAAMNTCYDKKGMLTRPWYFVTCWNP